MVVYAVSFRPTDSGVAAVGGFDWYYRLEDAQARFDKFPQEQGGHIEHLDVRLVAVEVPNEVLSPAITDYIDGDIDEIEVNLPAMRERKGSK